MPKHKRLFAVWSPAQERKGGWEGAGNAGGRKGRGGGRRLRMIYVPFFFYDYILLTFIQIFWRIKFIYGQTNKQTQNQQEKKSTKQKNSPKPEHRTLIAHSLVANFSHPSCMMTGPPANLVRVLGRCSM